VPEVPIAPVDEPADAVRSPEADVPEDVPEADVPEGEVPADVPEADVPEADVPDADVPEPERSLVEGFPEPERSPAVLLLWPDADPEPNPELRVPDCDAEAIVPVIST